MSVNSPFPLIEVKNQSMPDPDTLPYALQRLSATLPAFRPYATLEADDVEDCENELRREFASR